MASEEVKKPWADEDTSEFEESFVRVNDTVPPSRQAPVDDKDGEGSVTVAPDRDVETDHPTDQEREDFQRTQWFERVDGTEVATEGASTTAFRRAVAVFDPTDDQLQLAEFWDYRNADFEKHGRF